MSASGHPTARVPGSRRFSFRGCGRNSLHSRRDVLCSRMEASVLPRSTSEFGMCARWKAALGKVGSAPPWPWPWNFSAFCSWKASTPIWGISAFGAGRRAPALGGKFSMGCNVGVLATCASTASTAYDGGRRAQGCGHGSCGSGRSCNGRGGVVSVFGGCMFTIDGGQNVALLHAWWGHRRTMRWRYDETTWLPMAGALDLLACSAKHASKRVHRQCMVLAGDRAL
eukprot:scaffold6296_cov124-Isochrysis_galbana.AAC.4